MSAVGGRHVEAAVAEMVAVLSPHTAADWQVRAGSLEWSCWATASHVAHDLVAYAGQVAGRITDGYLPMGLAVHVEADPRQVLEVVSACGRLLRSAVADAEPGPVGWHWGMAEASGFAAMGVAEVLVHTFDITRGLGIDWRPPEHLCEPVVARLLPDAPPAPASDVLLWATGRGDLDDQPGVGAWVWRAALP